MQTLSPDLKQDEVVARRMAALFQEHLAVNHKRTDRMFAWLMVIQWLAGIVAALWISPKAWEGQYSHTHIHVWAALFLGGIISGFPVFMAATRPGSVLTRHVIAVGQMLSCGLLIHLTGGRIESHFQYFGALAFLAFYRDWRVLVTASVVAAADHFLRGMFWPQSIFGVLAAPWWRWLEHVGWVLFEDTFLVLAIHQSVREMRDMAERQAKLEFVHGTVERTVDKRTVELRNEIAERKRTEGQLMWKTALLEAQINSSQDGILVVDENDKKILQNQRTAELLKLPKEIRDDEHGPQQLQWVMGRVKNPEEFIERVNYIRSHPNEIGRDEVTFEDGTVLDRYSAPVVGKDRKRYGRIFTFRDITERKRADDLLQQSEKRYRSLFDNAKDAIFTIAADATFTSMNPAVEAMGGFSRADWIGKPFAPMVHPDDLPLAMEMFNRILRGEQASVHELRGNPSLKRPALMEMTLTSQRDETGKVIGVLGIGRDVTARKRAEEQLRESEGKFRQLAENINDVFWMTSPDLQQVLYVSPAYEKVWGRSAANAYEHPNEWSDAIVPEERERVFATFGRLMAGESSVSEEFRITRPDGELRWIHSRGFQVRDAAGKVIRLTGIASDITARKQFEAQLFQSQKLETVGKLSGGIAHEFNSILTAILGQCEMLLADLPSGSPSAKSATEIGQAAGRAATLTRQLLAYGRKQFLKPETLDLNRIITGMEGVFHHLMGGEVTTQIVSGPNLEAVKADAGQIEQVIMNMAINAREAMPNGGRLTVETANVSIDEESVGRYPELKAGKYVMLAITDTGSGMSEQVKARLFEPFFTTKGVGEGTGLGLSSCYGIIKQSGGHISVYSERGRGTTFKIYLPQVEQHGKTPLKPPSSLALPRGIETILLVEDDPALREMAETLLNRLGYKVWPAANGVEALSLKQQRNVGHIDLLFTDIVMPHMSGKELADRVRSLHPHTRILFTSAYTENANIHQGILDKGVALLQKPYTPSALAQKLREVLDQPNVPKPEIT